MVLTVLLHPVRAVHDYFHPNVVKSNKTNRLLLFYYFS